MLTWEEGLAGRVRGVEVEVEARKGMMDPLREDDRFLKQIPS